MVTKTAPIPLHGIFDRETGRLLSLVPQGSVGDAPDQIVTMDADAAPLRLSAAQAAALPSLVSEYGNGTLSGGLADRPAGTSLVLDSSAAYGVLTISGATAITVSGAKKGTQACMLVIADGTNVPTISGADEWASSFGYLNTAGVPNLLTTWHDGLSRRYSWSQQMTPVAIDLVAPTISSASVNGTTLTVVWSESLTSAPSASAFSVVGAGGVTQTPSGVSQSGTTTTLTLVTPAVGGNTVTLSVTAGAAADAAGNVSAIVAAYAVTNSTGVAAGAILTLDSLSSLVASGNTYTGSNGAANWVPAGSPSGKTLPANTAGWISVDWPNASNGAVQFGFDAASGVTYDQQDYMCQLSTLATQVRRGSNTATVMTIGTALTPGEGVRYRMARAVDGTVTIEESADSGSTWTVRYTFAAKSTTELYPKYFTLPNNTIVNPRAYGVA